MHDTEGGFYGGDAWSQMNGLVTSTGLRRMLEEEDCCMMHMVFPFVPIITYCATGFVEQASMKLLHTMCSDLASCLM